MGICHYRNTSGQMVILRCIGPQAFFQEKVVLPFEDWQFCCPPQSRVEIWTHGITGAELLDSIPADDLRLAVDVVTPVWGLGLAPAVAAGSKAIQPRLASTSPCRHGHLQGHAR